MLNLDQSNTSAVLQNYQALDDEGYLYNSDDWDKSFTEQCAAQKGVELTAQHWRLIELMRDKYLRLGALPPMRTVCRAVGLRKDEVKHHFGSCLGLWKMAGLPNPGEEAKSYMN